MEKKLDGTPKPNVPVAISQMLGRPLKKRNPQSARTRNVRHANKEIAALKLEVAELKKHIKFLEDVVRDELGHSFGQFK